MIFEIFSLFHNHLQQSSSIIKRKKAKKLILAFEKKAKECGFTKLLFFSYSSQHIQLCYTFHMQYHAKAYLTICHPISPYSTSIIQTYILFSSYFLLLDFMRQHLKSIGQLKFINHTHFKTHHHLLKLVHSIGLFSSD